MVVNYNILTFARSANKQDRMFSKNDSKGIYQLLNLMFLFSSKVKLKSVYRRTLKPTPFWRRTEGMNLFSKVLAYQSIVQGSRHDI